MSPALKLLIDGVRIVMQVAPVCLQPGLTQERQGNSVSLWACPRYRGKLPLIGTKKSLIRG